MINKDNYYKVVKSYPDPFTEGFQYVQIIENTKIFDYDKRKNKQQFECDVYRHTFHMNIGLLMDDKGLDEREFFIRLMDQSDTVKKKFDYTNIYIDKLCGDTLVQVGIQLSKYTNTQYGLEELKSMWGYPYSR